MKLGRWLTVPLCMSRRQALILFILLAIFAGALYLRLSVILGHWLPVGRDGPYNYFQTIYLLDHYPSMFSMEVPAFFHFAAWTTGLFSAFGASRITAFDIATALASALVVLTTFLMMRRLTKNCATALTAAFFSAFIPASFRVMGELQKNAFGITLAPLAVLFLWRGLEGKRKLNLLLAGVSLGVVGLTHQLVFGTLVIAYVSYLAFLLAYRRRIPWIELKAMMIVAISAACVCGWLYYGALGSAGYMAGERFPGKAILAAEGQQPPILPPHEQPINIFYDAFIGKLLLVLAAFGVGVAAYRRRSQDFFLLAWGMSSLLMAQSWVVQDYQWRFTLMLATPIALLAALGLVEGIGVLLWRSKKLGAFFGVRRFRKQNELTWAGRAAFLGLLIFIVTSQVHTSYVFARTAPMLQPTITMEEYNAMGEFREKFGGVYVFGKGDKFHYWPDAVGLKGAIQAAETVEPLSHTLMALSESQDAMQLAVKWYTQENQVKQKIYALESTAEPAQVLENTDLFMLVFNRPSLRAYALKEGFIPPAGYPSPGPGGGAFTLAPEPQGPGLEAQDEAPLSQKILLAPIYMLPGGMRFVAGVPLTVLLWIFLPCLGWEGAKKAISGQELEKLRKIIVVGLVIVLVVAVLVFVGGYGIQVEHGPSPSRQEQLDQPFEWASDITPGSGKGTPPPGVTGDGPWNHRVLSATSSDGLTWVKDDRIISDQASVPDAIVDKEGNIRVYYVDWYNGHVISV
ncbi:MAG: glycosyltransferase family 39 protein, partial [Candidatus Hadarchaeales archaeon]